MLTERDASALAPKGRKFLDTGTGDDAAVADLPPNSDEELERWQAVIDHRLLEWGRDPSQLDEDGLISPSRAVITHAWELALRMARNKVPAPLRVVPSGEGGIFFEWKVPGYCTLEIRADLQTEMTVFENSRVVHRERLG